MTVILFANRNKTKEKKVIVELRFLSLAQYTHISEILMVQMILTYFIIPNLKS